MAAAAVATLLMAPAAMGQITEQRDTAQAGQQGQPPANVVPAEPQPGIQAGREQENEQARREQQAGRMEMAGADTMPVDSAFLRHALSGNIKEVRLGELAQRQGENESVKDFGRRMVETHRQAYRETREIAESREAGYLDEMMPEDEAAIDRFRNLDGEAFDSAYIRLMVEDHAKEVALYRNQVQAGNDTEIRRYALATLPTLRDHFELAQRTAREVGVQVQTPLAWEIEEGANDTAAYRAPGRDSALAPADTSYMPEDITPRDTTPAAQPGDTMQMEPADTMQMQPADTMQMQPDTSMMQADTSITPSRDTTMVPGENVPRQAGTPQNPPVRPDTTSGLPPAAGDTSSSAAPDSMP
jgi:putative membrane protein